MLFLISSFNIDDGEFYFQKEKLTREQWERIFRESIYNEEICVFREDEEEYMLVIKKPTIEYKNLTKNYLAYAFPASDTPGEEIEPDDVTYNEIMDWIYKDNTDWDNRSLDFVEKFDFFTNIEKKLKETPKRRVFIANKYEELRSFKGENERHKAFPCQFHCFYVKFSKYDIRKVKSLHIILEFEKTGVKREFIYTFDEFLEFYQQDENLCEEAIVKSIKDFYSNTDYLSSYFRILTIDTSVCNRKSHSNDRMVKTKIGNAHATIIFPHIEDSEFERTGRFTKIYAQDYIDLFGQICGSQINILHTLEEYLPKINWRKRLGEFYFPY